jgi:hypothetical protein
MFRNYLSLVLIVILVVTVLVIFGETKENSAEAEYKTELEEALKENERLKKELTRVEEKVNKLTSIDNRDIVQAISVLEDYHLSKDIEEAKPFFSDEVYFPAEEDPDHYFNPNQIDFPMNYMFEWTPNHNLELKLVDFTNEAGKISISYETDSYGEISTYQYIMVKEDGWKIRKIEILWNRD